jgi:hypothetical protein
VGLKPVRLRHHRPTVTPFERLAPDLSRVAAQGADATRSTGQTDRTVACCPSGGTHQDIEPMTVTSLKMVADTCATPGL